LRGLNGKILNCGITILELNVVDWRQVGDEVARVKHYDVFKKESAA
jgi:hypothetical protein